jgi:lysophospholipase L1-like esterase
MIYSSLPKTRSSDVLDKDQHGVALVKRLIEPIRRGTLLLFAFWSTSARAVDEIVVESPQRNQVIQRVGYVPSTPEQIADQGGAASVTVRGKLPSGRSAREITCRILSDSADSGAKSLTTVRTMTTDDPTFQFNLIVPAGGWYRLELQCSDTATGQALSGAVERFGVGEVFLIAGQSYATNTNEEPLRIVDSKQRVVAYDTAKNSWAVANDPQPTPDGSKGGSIWPAVGELLVNELQVPIAFANVAFGGTSSQQWQPDSGLHQGLSQAGKTLGRFRAVLWQQGESDVINQTSQRDYVANVKRIRQAAVRAWGFEPTWLLAKSTHHPTVYNDPESEERIRNAIDELASCPGFGAGPDTDALQGENRGDANSRRHFSAIGQRRAGQLWYEVLSERLRVTPNGVEAASFLLPDLHLLEPAWSSEVVYRESSIILRDHAGEAGLARLAFPAAEILQISAANQQAQLQDFELLDDRSSVQFLPKSLAPAEPTSFMEQGIEPIASSELFPRVDSPNSYKYRVGNPEQSLLYRPGRWFHDRNVEITYRRDVTVASITKEPVVFGSLPGTQRLLQSGQSLTIGMSGDSISTGLDASALSAAPPFQPGYPDLVVAQLRVLFDSNIRLKNRAVAGWSVANGVADLDALLAEKPNLILIAYGMNDVGRRDPQWFADQTRTMLQRIQAADAEIEVVLISTMLGNKEWIHTPRDMFDQYRDELKSLIGPGVALADVTAVWELLLKRKHDLDLTGNGLNHPNDFAHRLYAQTLLQLLSTTGN